jgi:hypothetical protein
MPSVGTNLRQWPTSRGAIASRTVSSCVAAVLLALPALAACSSADDQPEGAGGSGGERHERSEPLRPTVRPPDEATQVVSGGPVESAASASAALYDRAPVVVLAAEREPASQVRAASVGVALGAPVLLAPDSASGEASGSPARAVARQLRQLEPRAVLTFGDPATRWAADQDAPVVPAPDDASDLADLTGGRIGEPEEVAPGDVLQAVALLERDEPPLLTVEPPPTSTTAPAGDDDEQGPTGAGEELPEVAPADPLDSVLVLADDPETDLAAAATARASGARVAVVAGADPRADPGLIGVVARHPPDQSMALGDEFGPPERLARRLEVVETGVELPGGGQVMFPGRRMAALYGHPGTPAMGVLGEQPVAESIARARELADQYQPLVDEPVVPAFELIATVASSAAGPDGDYSDESAVDDLRPWIDAAGEAGVYVVLDLQPGRTDFLTQARRYEDLLAEPHVGLALDPEWRLGPNQRHLDQIGSVGVAEINQVATWLADLTRDRHLPQKLLLVHQFRTAMISDRARMETSRDELSVLIHADGFGTRGQKFATWDALHVGPPPNITWGWKNFIDEDQPTFTPAQTVAIRPSPRFVSYQ